MSRGGGRAQKFGMESLHRLIDTKIQGIARGSFLAARRPQQVAMQMKRYHGGRFHGTAVPRSERIQGMSFANSAAAALLLAGGLMTASAQPQAPKVVQQDGRYALMVDGAPYLILGGQINNSSSWTSTMPDVWPVMEGMHANTVEAPVYWEQMEPQPGQFDFSTVDMLVNQARAHHMHLVLLWFGTWKNGEMHYAPQWIKSDPQKYPRMID